MSDACMMSHAARRLEVDLGGDTPVRVHVDVVERGGAGVMIRVPSLRGAFKGIGWGEKRVRSWWGKQVLVIQEPSAQEIASLRALDPALGSVNNAALSLLPLGPLLAASHGDDDVGRLFGAIMEAASSHHGTSGYQGWLTQLPHPSLQHAPYLPVVEAGGWDGRSMDERSVTRGVKRDMRALEEAMRAP